MKPKSIALPKGHRLDFTCAAVFDDYHNIIETADTKSELLETMRVYRPNLRRSDYAIQWICQVIDTEGIIVSDVVGEGSTKVGAKEDFLSKYYN